MNQEYKLSGKSGNIFFIGIPLGSFLAILLSIVKRQPNVYHLRDKVK